MEDKFQIEFPPEAFLYLAVIMPTVLMPIIYLYIIYLKFFQILTKGLLCEIK